MSSVQVIVGLGNPGKKYERTRHNVGRWVLGALVEGSASSILDWTRVDWARVGKSVQGCFEVKVRVGADSIPLIIPETYMNLSGEGVGRYLRYFGIPAKSMLVVYDELDLRPGVFRLKRGGSSGGHRGMESILQHVEDPDFLRMRVGIGHPRDVQSPLDVAAWVLSEPNGEDRERIAESVREAAGAIGVLQASGLEAAQNQFHKQNQ